MLDWSKKNLSELAERNTAALLHPYICDDMMVMDMMFMSCSSQRTIEGQDVII